MSRGRRPKTLAIANWTRGPGTQPFSMSRTVSRLTPARIARSSRPSPSLIRRPFNFMLGRRRVPRWRISVGTRRNLGRLAGYLSSPATNPPAASHHVVMADNLELAARIRAARNYARIKQKDMAKKLSVSIETYGRIEAGTRPASDEELAIISEACTPEVPPWFIRQGWLGGITNPETMAGIFRRQGDENRVPSTMEAPSCVTHRTLRRCRRSTRRATVEVLTKGAALGRSAGRSCDRTAHASRSLLREPRLRLGLSRVRAPGNERRPPACFSRGP